MIEQGALFDEVRKIIDILTIVKNKINDDTDVLWSRFDSPQALIDFLNSEIENLQLGKYVSVDNTVVLFAPTGALQEISISNGWIEEYIKISGQFDDVVFKLKNKMTKLKN